MKKADMDIILQDFLLIQIFCFGGQGLPLINLEKFCLWFPEEWKGNEPGRVSLAK